VGGCGSHCGPSGSDRDFRALMKPRIRWRAASQSGPSWKMARTCGARTTPREKWSRSRTAHTTLVFGTSSERSKKARAQALMSSSAREEVGETALVLTTTTSTSSGTVKRARSLTVPHLSLPTASPDTRLRKTSDDTPRWGRTNSASSSSALEHQTSFFSIQELKLSRI